MLNKELEDDLTECFKQARECNFEFVTVDHLLVTLLHNSEVKKVIEHFGLSEIYLLRCLRSYIESTTPKAKDGKDVASPSIGFQRVIQRAVFQSQSNGMTEVSGLEALIAIYSETESYSARLLVENNLTKLNILNFRAKKDESASENPFKPKEVSKYKDLLENSGKFLNIAYTENLNEKASKDHIDPLIGRKKELERIVQILARRSKNNPILIGEAGVGKTAIVEGLAQRIFSGNVPECLLNSQIFSLSIGSLLASTKYRGDVEIRMETLFNDLKSIPGSILYIDEIHMIVGAGSSSAGNIDIANLIKPLITSREITVIGSTTLKEFRQYFEAEKALNRRFQKIVVNEPSEEDTLEIIKGLKGHYEKFHDITYTDGALKSAVSLAGRYIKDNHFPDKAIDVLDEAAAMQQNLDFAVRKLILDIEDIEKTVAKIANIPLELVGGRNNTKLKDLKVNLKNKIFGQDDAINAIVATMKISHSGLRDPNKPIGSFLFVGPTGVGKTEVSKQLATMTGVELIRFDMSEYMERHSVSRLIGAPPGYVGYNEGGLLTEAVNKTPHAIVLLDEIEKAHPDVYNLLLQIMDHGTLTDMNGRVATFKHCVIIMTSNVGASEIDRNMMGFLKADNTSDIIAEVSKVFTPEFRNRLDAIIKFNTLSKDVITSVVDKFIAELNAILKGKDINLELATKAKDYLCEKGYNIKMGARPMAKTIQDEIKEPLADEILHGALINGGNVIITIEEGNIKLLIEAKELVV